MKEIMNAVDYWKTRCELAEKFIDESPCDPDIHEEQIIAHDNWWEFKKLPIPDVSISEAAVCSHEWTRPVINANNYQCRKCGIWKDQTDC